MGEQRKNLMYQLLIEARTRVHLHLHKLEFFKPKTQYFNNNITHAKLIFLKTSYFHRQGI